MKKTVPIILIICLLIGLPLMVIDAVYKKSGFTIPIGYKKIEIDLNEKYRNDEIIFSKSLKGPERVYFYIQSDSLEEKNITIASSKKFIGFYDKKSNYTIQKKLNNSCVSTGLLLNSGMFYITVSNESDCM